MSPHRIARPLTSIALIGLLAGGCTPEEDLRPPVTPPQPPAAGAKAPQPADPEPDTSAEVDALVAKHVAARGGAEKLRAIKTLRFSGRVRYGSGDAPMEMDYAMVQSRSGRSRGETTFQGITSVEAYDGAEAWSVDPFDGRQDAFRQSADDTRQMAHEADIDGPLVDWRQKGHKVDYLGTEDIDGTPAHKLRVRYKDGDVEYDYLDPDAFLTIRIVREARIRGVERVTETDLGDYTQVAGVWVPLSVESGARGRPKGARFHFDRVDANVELPDDLFRFPAAGTRVARAVTLPASAVPAAAAAPPAPAGTATLDAAVLSGIGIRNIGSAKMSGRVAAVAAYDDQGKTVIYAGAASGGVWKSSDGGTTFKPIFDRNPVQSIGAITLDPQDPRTVWVGTGESWTRNSVSIGDGIYKSTDGGATWKNMGLPASERIVRILVHPRNGNVVYACVPGKLWSDSPDRGVYKTEDGGKRWSLVLKGKNLSTGCSGLSMDPKDPEVLLAGTWDFRRKGWTYRSGGEGPGAPSGSGMFRTADGGKTWTELTPAANKGLPAGPWGRIEVAIAPSDPKVVYALIESKDSALYRSSDGGVTWEARDKSQPVVWRPFYFARLVVDPANPDRVFKPGMMLVVSEDGGRSFAYSGGQSHGDWHDVWVDPKNPKHLVGGDDGGLWISHDGGSRWWKTNNLPISQFYHVSVDQKDPYNVYGGLQDNSSWIGPSAAPGSSITNDMWKNLYGGDGFWTLVDPTDPESVYAEYQGGYIGRVDRRTMATRDIQPKAGYKEKLRFNWNTPIHVSPTQKGTIYIGAQLLFRSKDRGDSWERISPDLTTNDPEKQRQEQSGGITVDNSSAEMHTTIYSISESPRDSKVIWAGTDDGNLQVTRDGGQRWTNVVGNVPGLPKGSWVSWVEASRFDAGTAYAAFDRHTFGDMDPWVYKTTDHGQTWTRIVSPDKGVRGYAHVIKEDTVRPDLLFVGTEFGLWISADGGARWARLEAGEFPAVAVREIQIHPRENDLVIGTHGRGIWIVDDISPLRALSADVIGRKVAFLPGRPAQQRMAGGGGWVEGDSGYHGQNPASGAVITYYQRARHLYGPLKIEVLDDKGKVIDTLDASKRKGVNRVSWSMTVKPPRAPRGATVAFSATQGPRVLPGTYTVRLTKGAETIEEKITVGLDRRAPYKLADRKAQFEAAMKAHALFGEMSALSDRIEAARAASEARAKALPPGDALAARLRAAAGKLDEVRKKIVATTEGGAITGEERIREHLDQVYGAILGWEGKPGKYQVERVEALRRELSDVAAEFAGVIDKELKPLDAELGSRKLPPIPTAEAEGAPLPLAAEAARCAATRGRECPSGGRAAAAERD